MAFKWHHCYDGCLSEPLKPCRVKKNGLTGFGVTTKEKGEEYGSKKAEENTNQREIGMCLARARVCV